MKENEPIITMVHTMIENSALRPQLYQQLSQDECRGTLYKYRPEEVDIDAKLSRLCEQDKVVHALEEKLQQLHKEKYTLEQALLSASQEIEMNADNAAAIQTVVLQRDDLQNGLLSTCRELSRATAELERAWREYDRLEYDVTVTRNQMQEQLDRLGEVQTESAGIQRAQIQKELWRIQDVMEGLGKHKQQRGTTETGMVGPKPFSTVKYKNEEEEVVPPRPPLPRSYDFTEQPPIIPPLPSDSSSLLCYSRGPVHLPEEKKIHQVQGYPRNGSHCGPDYRLYKSEPELTTVAEVDESNGEEKSEPVSEMETSVKGSHFPVGVVPPRTKSPTPESSTIASYVTLRKTKKMMDSRTARRRDDDIKELDTVIRENDVKPNDEAPAAEIVRLKEAEPQNMDSSKESTKTENAFYETLFKPEPNGVSSEEVMDKERNEEKMPEDVSCSPQDETQITNHKAGSHPEEDTKDDIHEQEETAISYDVTPEASRGNQTMA
ncbi:hypothetical protein HPG69_004215, partial [Diceros bicornis minor]